MKIRLDKNDYVIEYATVGDIKDSIEYEGEIPSDFSDEFFKYKLENDVLVKDN